MCISAIAIRQSSSFPLIIIHNRDEYKNRSFIPMNTFKNIYGGTDIKSDGMWFGANDAGKIALITNVRDKRQLNPEAPSRGFLVKSFLRGTQSVQEYVQSLETQSCYLNPFNLVIGTFRGAFYNSFNNIGKNNRQNNEPAAGQELFYWNSDERNLQKLEQGLYGLSNARLDTPWPKVVKLKTLLQEAIQEIDRYSSSSFDPIEQSLFKLLQNTDTAPEQELPSTGVPLNLEKILSSIFIDTSEYGTVVSNLFLVNKNQEARIAEVQFDGLTPSEKRHYDF